MNISFPKAVLILGLLFSFNSAILSANKTDSIKAVISRLSEAINNSDTAAIKTDLSLDFSIHTSSWPSSGWYLNKILDSKIIRSAKYLAVRSIDGDTILVDVLFERKDGKKEDGIIGFDSQNKILFIDYFDRLYSPGRFAKSNLKEVIPFSLKNGNIILSLKLNNYNTPLQFIFDTGADGMAIRKSLSDSIGLTIYRQQQTNVVGASLQVSISSGNDVHLNDSLSLKNQSIAIFEQIEDGVDGIIGLNLCKEYIVHVDFDTQLLYLYSFGDYDFAQNGETMDITIPDGIILVPCTINIVGKKEVSGHFIFDTGANYHVIAFEQFVRKNRLLLSGFKSEEQASTVSMGISTPVFKGKTAIFRVGKNIERFDMPITLQASGGQSNNNKNVPDGSLGIQLLNQFNFTIDTLRKKIHLVPNQKEELEGEE